MFTIWELDFYSRPILNKNHKKIWELLICSSPSFAVQPFSWIKICDPKDVNSNWLAQELSLAIAYNTSLGNPNPQKVRFYRPSMTNIISRACQQAALVPKPTRRLFTLMPWLERRMAEVYPLEEGFTAPEPVLTFNPQLPAPQLAPALVGESWLVVSLRVEDFAEAQDWSMDFGEFFDITKLPADGLISGLIITSSRALALAAWLSGLDPVALNFLKNDRQLQLVLEAGEADRWILATVNLDKNPQALSQASTFAAAKANSRGIHFLAIQTSLETEHFAGFWLLKD